MEDRLMARQPVDEIPVEELRQNILNLRSEVAMLRKQKENQKRRARRWQRKFEELKAAVDEHNQLARISGLATHSFDYDLWSKAEEIQQREPTNGPVD
jgi:predicted  nucleic acid-binding Zn-ribbon protein